MLGHFGGQKLQKFAGIVALLVEQCLERLDLSVLPASFAVDEEAGMVFVDIASVLDGAGVVAVAGVVLCGLVDGEEGILEFLRVGIGGGDGADGAPLAGGDALEVVGGDDLADCLEESLMALVAGDLGVEVADEALLDVAGGGIGGAGGQAGDGWGEMRAEEEVGIEDEASESLGEVGADASGEAFDVGCVGGGDDANMPTTEITADKLTDGRIGILNLMVACGLAPSNKQARQLVEQGGVLVNDEKVPSAQFSVTEEMLKEGVKIRKGKKVFHKAVLA